MNPLLRRMKSLLAERQRAEPPVEIVEPPPEPPGPPLPRPIRPTRPHTYSTTTWEAVERIARAEANPNFHPHLWHQFTYRGTSPSLLTELAGRWQVPVGTIRAYSNKFMNDLKAQTDEQKNQSREMLVEVYSLAKLDHQRASQRLEAVQAKGEFKAHALEIQQLVDLMDSSISKMKEIAGTLNERDGELGAKSLALISERTQVKVKELETTSNEKVEEIRKDKEVEVAKIAPKTPFGSLPGMGGGFQNIERMMVIAMPKTPEAEAEERRRLIANGMLPDPKVQMIESAEVVEDDVLEEVVEED